MSDPIERQTVIDALDALCERICQYSKKQRHIMCAACTLGCAFEVIENLPSAQPERDIPLKPTETTDRTWGIPKRQAVCPKCDYYLGHIAFLDCYKGKRITYCETCGQAIDWEGWDFDE